MTTLSGTSKSYTLDRLHRDAPELYEQVVRGELSANAAAVKAGFRPRTITIRVVDPERKQTWDSARSGLKSRTTPPSAVASA